MNQHKQAFARLVASIAEHNSKDAETAKKYLKEQGIDVSADVAWITWLAELRRITEESTGCKKFSINSAEARKFYDDGFTPYQTFRETWSNENDSI